MREISPAQAQSHLVINQGASLVASTCPYCGVGCGVDVMVNDKNTDVLASTPQLVGISGTQDHPANYGRLCVKGSKLLETNSDTERMKTPKIAGQSANWQNAINKVASSFQNIIAKHGAQAVAFYVSGQLLTEDYYVANKLMKGYIGTANIDTNSRLCMSSAVAAYKRAFGADAVPCCYEDLELADAIILVGSNTAWTHPVLFQRIERAKKCNPRLKVVLIDPRKTTTTELADIHLAIKPGSDVALFNGLLHYLAHNTGLNQDYIDQFTQGFEQTLMSSQEYTVCRTASLCDIPEVDLVAFYAIFALQDKVVTAYSMGVNQSSHGVDKANAIINCHLASGKLGREGCGPFSLTGQPNAMGGREVGGLANMLACHMDLENPEHQNLVQHYWQSPTIATTPGFKAVELFEKIHDGTIKAVWIMATNPVVSMPNRDKIIAALKKCEMVVVSDCVDANDTLDFADVSFPATGWSEKNGTVTNSERRISRQRGLQLPFGEAKHDWQIICDVAKAMGFKKGFNFTSAYEIFYEYAGLSAKQNLGQRALDLSGLSQLSLREYDNLRPVQWPINNKQPEGTKRLFVDGRFYTPSGKAQFIPLKFNAPQQLTNNDFPFVLNSGRIRDQWHTMTRTGKAPELNAHTTVPQLAMHPQDAAQLKLKQGDFVELSAPHRAYAGDNATKIILSLKLDETQRKGELFAPIHWSLANASHAAISSLYSDANDVLSGQPELKHGAVSVTQVKYAWQGQLFIKHDISIALLTNVFEHYVVSTFAQGKIVIFASNLSMTLLKERLKYNFPRFDQWVSFLTDHVDNTYVLSEEQFVLALFASHEPIYIEVNWISHLMTQEHLKPTETRALLKGLPDSTFNDGPLVCSCFRVGQHTITQAILEGCNTVGDLGLKLKCGTNCGSCKTELSQMLKQYEVSNVSEKSMPRVSHKNVISMVQNV